MGYNPRGRRLAQSPVTQNYTYSLDDQTAFYVYPPSDGNGFIELNYAQLPAALAAEGKHDRARGHLRRGIGELHAVRACLKDAEYAAGATLATKYQQDFLSLVKSKEMSERKISANWLCLATSPRAWGYFVMATSLYDTLLPDVIPFVHDVPQFVAVKLYP